MKGWRSKLAGNPERRQVARWIVGVCLTAVAVYAVTLGHGFVFDDQAVIVRNDSIRSLANISKIFGSTEWAGAGLENHLYRPLTTTTYALNYAVAGLAPWIYHLTNVLLHASVTSVVLLLGVAWGLPVVVAGVGALLFAVHPIHVEAVASVVGRKELLAALFLVSMVLLHRRALLLGGVAVLFPALSYAAAMLSKEVGIVGVGLVALSDGIVPERMSNSASRRRAHLFAAYAVLALLYVAARTLVVGQVAVAIPWFDNPAAHATLGVRWMTGIAVIGKGLLLQAIPLNQSPDYSFNAIPLVVSVSDGRFLWGGLLIAVWVGVGLRLRKQAPVVGLGAGWYLLTILPASNIVIPTGTIFGERLLYVPSIGLLLAVTAGVAHLLASRTRHAVVTIALVVCVLGMCLATVRYASAWRTELTLFSVAADNVPTSTKVHHKLGEAMLAADQGEAAIDEARYALRIAPSNVRARVFLSDALRSLGRTAEAEQEIQRALALGPNADALYAAGRLLRDRGRLDEAAAYWTRAVEAEPTHSASLADLGTLALLRDDTTLAIALLRSAANSNPGQANAWYNLGIIHQTQGDRNAARVAFKWFTEVAGAEYSKEAARVKQELH